MKWSGLLIAVVLGSGCQRTEVTKAPEPPVQNVVTDYVDGRVAAMNKAQQVADKANAQIQKQNAQALEASGDSTP